MIKNFNCKSNNFLQFKVLCELYMIFINVFYKQSNYCHIQKSKEEAE